MNEALLYDDRPLPAYEMKPVPANPAGGNYYGCKVTMQRASKWHMKAILLALALPYITLESIRRSFHDQASIPS
jgi:hypothetical protein